MTGRRGFLSRWPFSRDPTLATLVQSFAPSQQRPRSRLAYVVLVFVEAVVESAVRHSARQAVTPGALQTATNRPLARAA
jgi:hypothetical protein